MIFYIILLGIICIAAGVFLFCLFEVGSHVPDVYDQIENDLKNEDDPPPK